MSLLHTKKQSVSGEYNFLSDPNAGAIGNVNTGIHLPSASMITTFWVNTLVAPLSGGAATISFGWQVYTNVGIFTTPAAFFPVTGIGAFVPGAPIFGVNLILNPIKFAPFNAAVSGVDVIMNIAGAALTDGRLQFWVEYNENDL